MSVSLVKSTDRPLIEDTNLLKAGNTIGDEILLSAVAAQKIATVKAPAQRPGTSRGFSAIGSVD